MPLQPGQLLTALPVGLRGPLLKHYVEIARNFVEGRWEPAELNAGKLCEVVYSVLDGATTGVYPSQPQKPRDMVGACRGLEGRPSDPGRVGDRSLRILIPRVLLGVYEVRNNRGVGHVAGEVDSNKMDATKVFGSANWILCELVRIFHQVDVHDAQAAVDALVDRRIPEIWEVGSIKRVLATALRARDQTLLLLYSEAGWVHADTLLSWIEYKNGSHYRTRVLGPLHAARHLEFDTEKDSVHISPSGVREVESKILPLLEPSTAS